MAIRPEPRGLPGASAAVGDVLSGPWGSAAYPDAGLGSC